MHVTMFIHMYAYYNIQYITIFIHMYAYYNIQCVFPTFRRAARGVKTADQGGGGVGGGGVGKYGLSAFQQLEGG